MRRLLPLTCALMAGSALSQTTAPAVDPHWEGAVGLVARVSPNYMGAATSAGHIGLGLFLRYGRFSVTNTGGFVTRRNDDVERGLTADLVQRDDLRVSLSLRTDGGRDAGSDPALSGLPDVRATLRARLAATHKWDKGWRISAGLSPDLFGRGGGITADAALIHEWRLAPSVLASLSAGGTLANRRYMQSYFGITPAQSAASGHAAYAARAGLRDLGLGGGLRIDISPEWLGLLGLNTTHLMGSTLDSPLTKRPSSWGVNGGLAWRF